MPPAAAAPLDDAVRAALTPVISRASRTIARAVADLVAERLASELSRSGGKKLRIARGRRRGNITRWLADRRARRVPTFVIEATGLDTKKAIVKKFGENAAFEKGKPLPKPK